MMTNTQEPIRVAYVIHTFEMGGLERCAARLADHLDPAKFEPMIVCLNRSGAAAQWIRRTDVPIVELNKRPGNDPLVVWRLAKTFRRRRVDIVHSHNWGTLLESALARSFARVPGHVHAEHGLELADLQIGRWRRRLRGRAARWALDQVDVVVAVADGVRERLNSRFGFPAEKVRLIPNGVESASENAPAEQRSRIRRSLAIPDDALVIGSIGRLAPVKDFGTAIQAVRRVAADGTDVHLVLVGDGPEKETLADKAAAGLAGVVHLVGQQRNIAPYLAAMDLYVNSSISEGMSLSILEAMSAGLPLAVTDVGENASLVDGDPCCGLVAPPQSPEKLAHALTELANDATRRRRFGQCAQQRFERDFSVQQMVTRYENLYLDIGSGRKHPLEPALQSRTAL